MKSLPKKKDRLFLHDFLGC